MAAHVQSYNMNESGEPSRGSQYHEEHVSHDLPDGHPDKPVFSMGVLISVDESPFAEAAFKWYVDNLHRAENHVTVFHAACPPQLSAGPIQFGGGFSFAIDEYHSLVEQRKDECRVLQLKYARLMKEMNLHGKVSVLWTDNAGHGITAFVKEVNENTDKQRISLVVMGSRGLGKIRRTFMGSVSSYVLHHVHVPIAVVPPEKHGHHM